jgi:hypothetical protein
MEYWEFLIQREGDRGWRTIKTGHLQLMEGKYRIVANSNLLDTQIQTRITHQTLALTVPQRRSRSCSQATNPKGLLVIIPFTHLHSGIWQFVCSSNSGSQTALHQLLKLRVLPRTTIPSPMPLTKPPQFETIDVAPVSLPAVTSDQIQSDTPQVSLDRRSASNGGSDDLDTPTEPLVPISMVGEQENWADGLDRLLAKLEWESLQPQHQQPAMPEILPGTIQFKEIVDPPLQLISLDRSTFSGLIPGNRLLISGGCNLQLSNTNLVQTVKIEKLSICLRHPKTSEVIVSIEQSLLPNLKTFTFHGQLELPPQPKISLLLGEVNLYDKHHIQLGSSGFTVTLNLNPLHESERSAIQLRDRHTARLEDDLDYSEELLLQELQSEAATIGARASISHPDRFTTAAIIKPLNSDRYSTIPITHKRESLFTHPDIVPVNPAPINHLPRATPQLQSQHLGVEITGDLEIDFALSTFVRHDGTHNYENLEIVIDD